MLSISDMLEKIPSAKMDEDEECISISIREYENYRNMSSLQDKQSIIKDLQLLLMNKDADLQRYKDKCEQVETVLQKTQKTLDKRLQCEQAQVSIPLRQPSLRSQGIIPLKRSDSKGNTRHSKSDNSVEVLARATGSGDSTSKSEDPVTASLPNSSGRPGALDDCTSLKSLPLSLSIGSPGMSTALFKRLVQENLKLKAQLERRNIGLPKLSKDPERAASDLKMKLEKKQQLIDDLTRAASNGGQGADHLALKLAELHKENEKCNEMIEMEKIIIESLKQENSKYKKEKEELENLLKQYRQLKSSAQATDEKVSELESRLKVDSESRKLVEGKLDSSQKELDRLRQTLEKTEQEKELIQTNYNTLCAKYHKLPPSQPTYKVSTPQLPSHALGKRLSQPRSPISPQGYSTASSYGYQTREPQSLQSAQQPPLPRRPSESMYGHTSPQTYGQQPQEPSIHRASMSQSTYHGSSSPSPSPSERKTFKCPRCDLIFNVLQGYRDHIKICLKG